MQILKNLFDFISEYESVNRFSRNYLVRPENLVQHVGIVSIICAYILNKMTEDFEEEIFSTQECCSLMMRAVVHDMDEIVTGDIVRPTKYASREILGLIKQLEQNSIGKIIEKFNLPTRWEEDWRQAKKDLIGQILKVADTLAVSMTCYREIVLYSNNQFRKVAFESQTFIKNLIDTYKGMARVIEQEEWKCHRGLSEDAAKEIYVYEFLNDLLTAAYNMSENITKTTFIENNFNNK